MARSPRPHRPPVGAPLAAPQGPPPALSITISLAEIYHSLCPSCRDALVDLLSHKAGDGLLRDALRSQLDAQLPPLPPHLPQPPSNPQD